MTLGMANRQDELFDEVVRFCDETLPERSIYATMDTVTPIRSAVRGPLNVVNGAVAEELSRVDWLAAIG